jgi:hypothetical protein
VTFVFSLSLSSSARVKMSIEDAVNNHNFDQDQGWEEYRKGFEIGPDADEARILLKKKRQYYKNKIVCLLLFVLAVS